MSIAGLTAWLATAQGRYVLAWEQERYDQVVADIFGFNALQMGMTQCDFLRANRMPFRQRCDPDGPAEVRTHFEHLPYATSSLDLVVMPHVLEFSPDPHQILREVERVLVPEGQIVIAGFNPYSLWGMRRKLARCEPVFPWNGNYLGVLRVRDWLKLLGFETQFGGFGCYAPAAVEKKWLQRYSFMEMVGARWWPIAGAVYMLQAIKRVPGMRVILPAWRERRARAKAKALAPVIQKFGTPRSSDPNYSYRARGGR
jgi:SAM-dependent methyltransferase